MKDFLRNRALKKSNSFLEFVFFEFGCLRLQTKFGLDRFSRFDYLLDRDGQTDKQSIYVEDICLFLFRSGRKKKQVYYMKF